MAEFFNLRACCLSLSWVVFILFYTFPSGVAMELMTGIKHVEAEVSQMCTLHRVPT